MEAANIVKLADGREATLGEFNALDGFEIKHQWLEVHETNDDVKRRRIIVRVLAYVSIDGRPLAGEGAINAALKSWLDVDKLVESCLAFNSITSKVVDDALGPKYAAIGEQMGAGFLGEVVRMYGPMLELMAKNIEESK
ncbi:hypothetical protein P3T43_001784 [Paraburkholderia sp. GAS41]|uniref:hypothetical protein n=1 Tax=Paraburkholderia sp. GAS41 TaxID=3035134 RepID=UPI003D1D5AAF